MNKTFVISIWKQNLKKNQFAQIDFVFTESLRKQKVPTIGNYSSNYMSCYRQGHLPLDQIVQSLIQSGLECF